MKKYWVIGGLYSDANFDLLEEGHKEERIGPFSSYEAAKAEWQRLSWEHVDNALYRYQIKFSEE